MDAEEGQWICIVFLKRFLLYRKFLKSREIVYNEVEIKNCIAKKRRVVLRDDFDYEVFCFVGGCTI